MNIGNAVIKVYFKQPCGLCKATGKLHYHNELDEQNIEFYRECPVCRGTGAHLVEQTSFNTVELMKLIHQGACA